MTAVISPVLRYDSVDDYLGPSHGRFFGSGYRRATYRVEDLVVTPGGDGGPGGVRSRVGIAYPADWSRKTDEVDLRPHLSTVDMLVLAVQLGEAHVTHAYGLDETLRRTAWVRKITLRAGGAPQEELTGLAGTAKLVRTDPVPAADGSFVSTYDCQLGQMRARVEIVHPVARVDVGEATFESLAALLGDPARRYYGDGFTHQQHRITDVEVDLAELTATARVGVDLLDGGVQPSEGVEGGYQPSWSLLDCFVTNLQLTQVMMYELDQVRRADSNTLWMLKTVLETGTPHRPYSGPVPTRAAITEKHLVALRGGTWRNVTVTGESRGVTLRASFAHELPAGVPAVTAADAQASDTSGRPVA